MRVLTRFSAIRRTAGRRSNWDPNTQAGATFENAAGLTMFNPVARFRRFLQRRTG